MLYQSFLPSSPLQELVRNYTLIHFQFNPHEPIPSKQRSAKPEEKIVFYLQGRITLSDPKTGIIERPSALSVFTHQLDTQLFQVTPRFEALIIYLRPGVLYRITGIPASEFPHRFCDAQLLFNSTIRDVQEQLQEVRLPMKRIQIVEKFLLSLFPHLRPKNTIEHIADHLLADPTSFSLDALADQACLSTRQFYRKFTEHMGISPKLFSRLSRFNHAYRYKIENPDVSWSSVAQEFRYTDYHHLEKEFKAFAGQSPSRWLDTHMGSPERMLKLR